MKWFQIEAMRAIRSAREMGAERGAVDNALCAEFDRRAAELAREFSAPRAEMRLYGAMVHAAHART